MQVQTVKVVDVSKAATCEYVVPIAGMKSLLSKESKEQCKKLGIKRTITLSF